MLLVPYVLGFHQNERLTRSVLNREVNLLFRPRIVDHEQLSPLALSGAPATHVNVQTVGFYRLFDHPLDFQFDCASYRFAQSARIIGHEKSLD